MATYENEIETGASCMEGKGYSTGKSGERGGIDVMAIDEESIDKLPPWQQEIIQRKKNLKVVCAGNSPFALNSEETASAATSAGNDIIITTSTNTPAAAASINTTKETSTSCYAPIHQTVPSSVMLPSTSLTSLSSSSSPQSSCIGHSHSPHAQCTTKSSSITMENAQQIHQQQANTTEVNATIPYQAQSQSQSLPQTLLETPLQSSSDSRVFNSDNNSITTSSTSNSEQETQIQFQLQQHQHQQSHSKHGNDHIVVVVASEQASLPPKSIVETKKCIFNKNPISNSTANNNKYSKSSERQLKIALNPNQSSSTTTKMVVAMQECVKEDFRFDDTMEELQYGPGIVSKLRCRYLSLALRQTVSKQRPSLDNLRRATSLNNLLDDEDDDGTDQTRNHHHQYQNGQIRQKAQTPDEYVPIFYRKNVEQHELNRCRQPSRGNDSMKRARSVEALLRYDHKAWQRDMIKDASPDDVPQPDKIKPPPPDVVTIEDKIANARERGELRPKRLTSFMDETERPPPDLVKHTLRIFEATANRRPKNSRFPNGEVAAKVATFKTIISQEKPPIVYPKPPLSPKKPIIKPRTSSPKIPTTGTVGIVNGNNQKNNNFPAVIMKLNKNSPISNLDVAASVKTFEENNYCRSPSPLIKRNDGGYRTHQQIESPQTPPPASNVLKSNSNYRPRHPDLSMLSPIPAPRTMEQSNNNELDNASLSELSKKFDHMSIEPSNQKCSENDDNDDDSQSDNPDQESDLLDGNAQTKHISKIALANISKAGTTTEFKFSAAAASGNKSHLPGIFNGNSISGSSKKFCDNNEAATNNVRQIGIIRPQIKATLLATQGQQHQGIVKQSQSNNDIQINKQSSSSSPSPPQINNDKSKRDNLLITNLLTSSASNNSVALTSREIEKNLINREKSEEAKWTASPVASSSPLTVMATTIKTGTPPRNWQHSSDGHNNTMVFNFSNRKEVPDYIENDGLVIRRKRELPKPGESGFVLLGDLTVETSTDSDDSWTLGPPSPCDVEFMNDNVIIDGKSSLRDKSKANKLKIQFNDTLTKTFEYPSESSLLEDTTADSANDNGIVNNGLLGSMALGSAPLGSYTPVKASLNTNFELGVTRSQTSTPTGGHHPEHITNDQSIINHSSSPNNGINSSSNYDANTSGGGSGAGGDIDLSDSLQYLKPATDEQTVAWSEGTRVTDLLF